jgi:hypothetical protein
MYLNRHLRHGADRQQYRLLGQDRRLGFSRFGVRMAFDGGTGSILAAGGGLIVRIN